MSNVEEVKARVSASAAQTREALVRLRGVNDQLEEAVTSLRLSAVGAVHPSLHEAIAQLEQARQRVDEAQVLAASAVNSTEQWRAIV